VLLKMKFYEFDKNVHQSNTKIGCLSQISIYWSYC